MLLKYCEYCKKIQPYNHQCERKPKKTSPTKREDFYLSMKWIKKREQIKQKCFGLDIYDLMVNKTITYGRTVHHIIPLDVDRSLALSDDNLIFLSESNHKKIHQMLKADYNSTVQMLKDCLNAFKGLKLHPGG
jgi:hypothetical protein